MEKIKIIEIERKDFLFGVMALQLDSDDPLYGFLHESARGALRGRRIELLGQLLGDGTTTSGLVMAQESAFHNGTSQGTDIDARMFIETDIFRGHKGLKDVGGDTVVINKDAIFVARPRTDDFAIGSNDLRGVFADGALEFIQRGHISNPALTDAIESSCHQQHQQHEDTPHKCHEYFSHKLYSSFWRAHTASLLDASQKYMQTYSKWSK